MATADDVEGGGRLGKNREKRKGGGEGSVCSYFEFSCSFAGETCDELGSLNKSSLKPYMNLKIKV